MHPFPKVEPSIGWEEAQLLRRLIPRLAIVFPVPFPEEFITALVPAIVPWVPAFAEIRTVPNIKPSTSSVVVVFFMNCLQNSQWLCQGNSSSQLPIFDEKPFAYESCKRMATQLPSCFFEPCLLNEIQGACGPLKLHLKESASILRDGGEYSQQG
jgi:hypothetical protein